MDVLTVYIGDRLGLYRALHDGGRATAADLAARAGIHPRYAREWLEQQAATGILDVDDVTAPADARRFSLPEAYAAPLLDRDSPWSVAADDPGGRGHRHGGRRRKASTPTGRAAASRGPTTAPT